MTVQEELAFTDFKFNKFLSVSQKYNWFGTKSFHDTPLSYLYIYYQRHQPPLQITFRCPYLTAIEEDRNNKWLMIRIFVLLQRMYWFISYPLNTFTLICIGPRIPKSYGLRFLSTHIQNRQWLRRDCCIVKNMTSDLIPERCSTMYLILHSLIRDPWKF